MIRINLAPEGGRMGRRKASREKSITRVIAVCRAFSIVSLVFTGICLGAAVAGEKRLFLHAAVGSIAFVLWSSLLWRVRRDQRRQRAEGLSEVPPRRGPIILGPLNETIDNEQDRGMRSPRPDRRKDRKAAKRRKRREHLKARILKKRVRRFRRFKRKQCRKRWYARQRQRVTNLLAKVRRPFRRRRQPRSAPLLERMVRLGFIFRVSNNARAVLFLLMSAFGFCANIAILVAGFIFQPSAITASEQRMYNFIRHGARTTDLEMTSFIGRLVADIWSVVQNVQVWLWIGWVIFALFSIVYLIVALREEFAEVIESAREAVAERGITDLPDQEVGKPAVPQPAGAAGAVSNFLKNRLRFAAEDLTWEMIQEGIQRGWNALRGG